MKRKHSAPVKFGASSSKRGTKHGRRKMNCEPRTEELSRDNFDAAIETFLRATKAITNDEEPKEFTYFFDKFGKFVEVTINFKHQEVTQDQTTVH
jgi:hypothetical protein